ncbi:hypothetical protein BCR35DRAFT_311509 [Leucosporidium creatinivorum]|uniref:Manganese/iron superoxide dismutase C-terminal domain-containing protein n=1 Tax=Leucosporidium creatinivorum TaxID=106004 RepID=A0A1Y2BXW9_9BASI|nr:hypothetical protein BCR35DRAFT_311509 [Leucosporidium creatinivorum]
MAALRSLPLRSFTRPAATPLLRRQVHQRVPLPYDLEQGLSPFLSPNALKTIAVDWQQGVLSRLNQLVQGTDAENLSVLQTLKHTATNPTQSLAFNYASEALNNSFFLSTLSPTPTAPTPSSSFSQSLLRSPLKSFPSLISHFSSHVSGLHPSSGAYIWLVTDQGGNLGVLGTYAGGTPLVHQRRQVAGESTVLGEVIPEVVASEGIEASEGEWQTLPPSQASQRKASGGRSGSTSHLLDNMSPLAGVGAQGDRVGKAIHPLLCLSVHPHCYLEDYGVWGREEYVRQWWANVDWKKVEESFAGFTKN